MKKMKRAPRMILVMCLTAVMLCGTCLTAFAADTADIDFGKKGSISLTLYSDETESAVTDGALTLYEVASLTLDDGAAAYVKTPAFEGFEGTLDIDDRGLADSLAEYISLNDVAGTTKSIASDGSIFFSDLTPGLYLVVQTTQSAGYYMIDSFLVTVPLDQDGVWAYDVNASPKVQVYAEPEPEPEPGSTPEPNPEPEPTPEPNPEPEPTPEPNPEPEPTPEPIPTPAPAPTLIPDRTLPQTGQLFWPIPILACGGAFFFLVGAVRRKRQVYAA